MFVNVSVGSGNINQLEFREYREGGLSDPQIGLTHSMRLACARSFRQCQSYQPWKNHKVDDLSSGGPIHGCSHRGEAQGWKIGQAQVDLFGSVSIDNCASPWQPAGRECKDLTGFTNYFPVPGGPKIADKTSVSTTAFNDFQNTL